MAGYLLHTGPYGSDFVYRGFILNGRIEGWNPSVRMHNRHAHQKQIRTVIQQDMKNAGPITEALTGLL